MNTSYAPPLTKVPDGYDLANPPSDPRTDFANWPMVQHDGTTGRGLLINAQGELEMHWYLNAVDGFLKNKPDPVPAPPPGISNPPGPGFVYNEALGEWIKAPPLTEDQRLLRDVLRNTERILAIQEATLLKK